MIMFSTDRRYHLRSLPSLSIPFLMACAVSYVTFASGSSSLDGTRSLCLSESHLAPTASPQTYPQLQNGGKLSARKPCRTITVALGEGCDKLAVRCGFSAADFTKFNPQPSLCATLKPDDAVCHSVGGIPAILTPTKNSDGTCASHMIGDGDNCDSLARKNGPAVDDLESFNQNKTWMWSECKRIQKGYNIQQPNPGNRLVHIPTDRQK